MQCIETCPGFQQTEQCSIFFEGGLTVLGTKLKYFYFAVTSLLKFTNNITWVHFHLFSLSLIWKVK